MLIPEGSLLPTDKGRTYPRVRIRVPDGPKCPSVRHVGQCRVSTLRLVVMLWGR